MTVRGAPPDDSVHQQRFRALWADHYADVLAFVLRRVGDRAVADDIVAETYLAAWRRRNQLPEDARPWLFGAARKVIGNSRRGERRRAALLAKVSGEAIAGTRPPTGPTDRDAEIDARVAAAFNRLSETDREILALVVWDDLLPSEAARVLGMPAARFGVRLHRAKERLRRQLTAADPEPCAPPCPAPAPRPAPEIRS